MGFDRRSLLDWIREDPWFFGRLVKLRCSKFEVRAFHFRLSGTANRFSYRAIGHLTFAKQSYLFFSIHFNPLPFHAK